MKPYRLKHVPTGLYFQPHKHRGSHLSKSGKIYQTNSNGLSESENGTFRVRCRKDHRVHKMTLGILVWQDYRWGYNEVYALTNVSDWVKEEI